MQEAQDLPRRVQAHEELLTALMAALCKTQPAVLTELESMFAKRTSEAGHPDTVEHAQEILRVVRRIVGAN